MNTFFSILAPLNNPKLHNGVISLKGIIAISLILCYIIIMYFFAIPFDLLFLSTPILIVVLRSLGTRDGKPKQHWEIAGDKIYFSYQGISIISNSNNKLSFPYTAIRDFHFHFRGMKSLYNQEASTFSWEMEGKQYEYPILLDSEPRKEALLALLSYFYKKEIDIHERDEEGKELKFLHIIQDPVPRKEVEIAPEIQDLIDEIGENDT